MSVFLMHLAVAPAGSDLRKDTILPPSMSAFGMPKMKHELSKRIFTDFTVSDLVLCCGFSSVKVDMLMVGTDARSTPWTARAATASLLSCAANHSGSVKRLYFMWSFETMRLPL